VLGGDVNKNYLHDGILDLHKPYVDEVVLVSDGGGKPMRREPDLIDVWFDSGAMPYAQWGLPPALHAQPSQGSVASGAGGAEVTPEQYSRYIAQKEGRYMHKALAEFNEGTSNEKCGVYHFLPPPGGAGGADFIAEGVDQTRGWFYTLHALGVMLFDNVAYKTVVSNGLVLDKNGAKMSKRVGNVVDPFKDD
jgi:isoleucyl-tRNA synthetase